MPEPELVHAESQPTGELGSLEAQLADARRDLRVVGDEHRAALDREAVLRGELQHRVRNILGIVRSIFARTVAAGGSLDDVADHFRGRLDAISRYQSPLGPGRDFDLEFMIRDELRSFNFGDQANIAVGGPEVRLSHDTAQILGLAVHELATNSIKFGALSSEGESAQLEIAWRMAESRLRLEWCESGVAVIAAAPVRRGFGREYIEEALPYQLDAETAFELRPGGVFCTIVLQLDTVVTPLGA